MGTPFRLHGRDPETGLDCIGVLAAALVGCGQAAPLPAGYRLRMIAIDDWLPDPAALGFAPAVPPFEDGDVVLLRAGAVQFHLAIAAGGGSWIHAHAGLRRVVCSPAVPDGTVVHHWRPLAPN